jgi:histidine triad (HIT) family protein
MLKHRVDVIVLAGYMKQLGPKTLSRFAGRILNIHPALLPEFGGKGMYGMHVHEVVIASGRAESGVSIHVVNAEYDTGPVIAQAHVPVEPGDTPETLAARVLLREHTFFAETLQKIVTGEIVLPPAHDNECIFCQIARKERPASMVYEDDLTMAFVDLRQFHPGHTLVIPRQHFPDVRELDAATGAALMATVSRITRAVGLAFPNEGMSLWHSIGPAAFQEVPHLHIHVHPRRTSDGVLRVYPETPPTPNAATLETYATKIRGLLEKNPESA